MSAGECGRAAAVRLARTDDLAAIVELLTGCALPSADLSVAQLANFFVATVNDRLVGVAGLEPLESLGLLRSLAVVPENRNAGLAHRLVAACEARATDLRSIADLYLLTTTAADYFMRRGYSEVPRESVPSSIAVHPQFLRLCPASARCFWKNATALAGVGCAERAVAPARELI